MGYKETTMKNVYPRSNGYTEHENCYSVENMPLEEDKGSDRDRAIFMEDGSIHLRKTLLKSGKILCMKFYESETVM